MKTLVTFLVLLPLLSVSQTNGEKLIEKGDRTYTQGKYDSTFYYYETYLENYETVDIKKTGHVLNAMADIYNRIGKRNESLERAMRIINEFNTPDNLEEVASAHVNISNTIAIYDSDFDSALVWVNNGIKLLLDANMIGKPLAQAYRSQGVTYYDLVDFQKAADSYKNALAVLDQLDMRVDKQYSLCLNNLANAYNALGDYYKALETHQRALELKRGVFPSLHPEIASSYNNIGNSYHYLEQYDKALEHFNLALDQRMKLFENSHPRIAVSLNNIGNVYFDMGEYEKSIDAHSKALNIRKNLFGETHSILLFSYHNLAQGYSGIEMLDSAIFYSEKATEIHQVNYGQHNDLLSMIYLSQAEYISRLGNYKKAEELLDESLAYLTDTYESKHPRIGRLLRGYGELYMKQSQYEKASRYFQKAMIALVKDFDSEDINQNPSSQDVLDPGDLIEAFEGKSRALHAMWSNNEMNDLATLSATLQAADDYVREFKQDLSYEADLKRLGEQSAFIYQTQVEVNYQYYVLSKEERYLENIFTAMEKNRSNLLFQKITSSNAKSSAGLPDSLLRRERDLLASINQFKSEDNIDSLFVKQRAYEELKAYLESEYPKYYELKNQLDYASIADVRKNLDNDEAFIEYQLIDSILYSVYIDNQTKQITRAPIPSNFKTLISVYMNYISDPSIIRNDSITAVGRELSKLLKSNALGVNGEVKHLIIVPDGVIGQFPIGLLPDENDSYLLETYSFQYAYSARTLFDDDQIRVSSVNFGGFAPTYEGLEIEDTNFSLVNLRSKVVPLKWNETEIESIVSALDAEGDTYLAGNATESNFISNYDKYSVLHLATHGFVNPQVPLNSKLIFSAESDSIHDNMLHAYEIYNLDLNTDLAVLSACNTGAGEYSEGEGVMSLAHAFRYAGASSVVMSHWAVDDKSTYEIMEAFYQNLNEGQSKSEALRNAKLSFLSAAPAERKHPFYWSSFVLVGKDKPLAGSNSFMLYFVILVGVVFVAVVARKRMKS